MTGPLSPEASERLRKALEKPKPSTRRSTRARLANRRPTEDEIATASAYVAKRDGVTVAEARRTLLSCDGWVRIALEDMEYMRSIQ